MSVEAQAWAYKVPLKPCPKSVLVALANRADEEGYCWPGLADLELRTGWSRRAIQEAIRYLVSQKLLHVSARHTTTGQQTSNLYQLSMDTTYCVEGAPPAPLGVRQVRVGGAPPAPLGVRQVRVGGAPPAPLGVRQVRGEGAPPAPKSSSESSSEQSQEEDPPSPHAGGSLAVVVRCDEDFEAFWSIFPNKVGKKAAYRSWKKARDKPSIEKIVKAVQVAMRSRKWRDGFVPNPATWLNQGRWDDQHEGTMSTLSVAKACVPVAPRQAQGESCPPEVAARLSRLFGKTFSFTADGQHGAA